ncbi:MAG: hypothetical protein HC879_05885 [Leptolyngbyaceae cyanobacterium SL_5_9]|nr:hypothetical protein [Leptolyngbyaceae cyanobacterium SL_5_9]NJO74707.1 hypothetical protein [Leptolyngbyaceae cyanobacterium RM1_406_9]
MVDPMDDIARQARQGSVAAIIQVLNEKLADSGVRTRAILSEGILQLLCEAPRLDQLEKPILVNQIRQILESLQPRGIRRVRINSRIVREQQLLWLEEINRDPENQVLWSEEIRLSKLNPLQRLSQDWKTQKTESSKALPKSANFLTQREKRQFFRGIFGGAALCLLLLVGVGLLYTRFGAELLNQFQRGAVPEPEATEEATSAASASLAPENPSTSSPSATSTSSPTAVARQEDPFAEAVRLAEQAATEGQAAESSADWLELATRWQRASDLMAQVTPEDGRYQTAQNRMQVYRQNSEAALQQAQSRRTQPEQSTQTGN